MQEGLGVPRQLSSSSTQEEATEFILAESKYPMKVFALAARCVPEGKTFAEVDARELHDDLYGTPGCLGLAWALGCTILSEDEYSSIVLDGSDQVVWLVRKKFPTLTREDLRAMHEAHIMRASAV